MIGMRMGMGLGMAASFNSNKVAAWDPSGITGFDAWYEAHSDYFTAEPGGTATWVAKAGGEKPFTVADGNAPTLSTDKLVFVANNADYLERADGGLSGEGTVTLAVVVKFTRTSSDKQNLFAHDFGSGNQLVCYATPNLRDIGLGWSTDVAEAETDADALQATYRLMIFSYVSGGISAVTGYKCALAGADASASNKAGTDNFGTGSLYIGKSATSAAYYINAEIKAVVVVKGAISGDDLTNLKSYCVTNYGADL